MPFTIDKDVAVVKVGQTNGQTNPVTGAACAILFGQGITIRDDDGLAYLACAASGETDLPCIGVATADVKQGDMLVIKRMGDVRDVPGLAAGLRVYVSNTPGGFSNTPGDATDLVGFADQCDGAFFFSPDYSVAPSHTAES
jgi:hypothetical protein